MALIFIFMAEMPNQVLNMIIIFKFIWILVYIIFRPYKVRIFNCIRILNEIIFIILCALYLEIYRKKLYINSQKIVPDDIIEGYFNFGIHINRTTVAYLIINLIYFFANLCYSIYNFICKYQYKFFSEKPKINLLKIK
jgi:hypothetical protein